MRRSCSISRSTAPASPHGSKNNSARHWSQATSSSWTISPATRRPPSQAPSGPEARASCSCRPPPSRGQALQPRSQSDRAGLLQAQAPPAQSRRAIRRNHMAPDRLAARRLLPRRMCQLLQKLRLCVNVMSSESSSLQAPCAKPQAAPSDRSPPSPARIAASCQSSRTPHPPANRKSPRQRLPTSPRPARSSRRTQVA